MATCEAHPEPIFEGTAKIALIGNPNVGKSMLFHRLTGRYVIVSNYPGTTVEITQGVLRGMENVTLIDTPGIIAFPPRGEDEAVTERVLLQNNLKTVLQVGDAKNLRRTLHLTVQLAEMGVPLVLALNMMDEAYALGLTLDTEVIEKAIAVPVVRTVATRGRGVMELIQAVNRVENPALFIRYPENLETGISEVEKLLPDAPISKRSLALLWLSNDSVSERWIAERVSDLDFQQLMQIRSRMNAGHNGFAAEVIQQTREEFIASIASQALTQTHSHRGSLGRIIGHLSTHPVWGLPILIAVLAAMYWFVGVFGAGTLVGLLEEDFFRGIINPWMIAQAERLIPPGFFLDLFFGEYGIWTMGVTYALALLLPIVFTFFILFGILEDSGYLPRLAVLSNRVFSWIGLNGQAILPMILGLGCVTMATMTTRILSRPRDRIMVTLLLALAIPCSAQLGVVMGMLAGISLTATIIWTGLVLGVMILVGWLAARLIKGERTPLVVELPPLRFPVLSNVFIKTIARLEWYIKEAVPLFILGTVILFALEKLHVLPWLINSLEPIVTQWLGLPASAATAFLLGLMRRDFAATGLFVMQSQGDLSPLQALVAISTITLFIPCIASIFMIAKERGIKIALGMIAFIFPFAILVGGILFRLLSLVSWNG